MTSQGTRDRLVRRLRDNGIQNEKVLKAIATTPRHEFVDEALSSRAYEDTALPIGLSQTISQPWVVARMAEALLECGVVDKVLAVGTGVRLPGRHSGRAGSEGIYRGADRGSPRNWPAVDSTSWAGTICTRAAPLATWAGQARRLWMA